MTNQKMKVVIEDYKLTIVMYNDTSILTKWNRCGNDYSKWIGNWNWDILKKRKIYDTITTINTTIKNKKKIEILLMTNIRHNINVR